MTYKLYRTILPQAALTDIDPSVSRQLTQSGLLSGSSTVANIAGDPPDLAIRGDYRGKYAEKLAVELRELASSDLPFVPLYNQGTDQLAESGYYTVQTGSTQRVTPQSPKFNSISADLVQADTRASAWRAVETKPTQPSPGNDFGNDTTALVGVPSSATKVRWYNSETQSVADVTVQATRSAEFGDLDMVDAQAAPYADPTLIFDLPYADAGDVDVGVWDSYDRAKRDSDGVVAWQRVFDPSHDYRGSSVVDTGLLRVTADEDAQSLTAETWDDSAGEWMALTLGVSDWVLFDWDVRSIGMAEVRVLAEFRDPTASEYYSLEGVVTRGSQDIQWLRTENEADPVPSGLQDLLDPIASESVVVPTASSALVSRTEVR